MDSHDAVKEVSRAFRMGLKKARSDSAIGFNDDQSYHAVVRAGFKYHGGVLHAVLVGLRPLEGEKEATLVIPMEHIVSSISDKPGNSMLFEVADKKYLFKTENVIIKLERVGAFRQFEEKPREASASGVLRAISTSLPSADVIRGRLTDGMFGGTSDDALDALKAALDVPLKPSKPSKLSGLQFKQKKKRKFRL